MSATVTDELRATAVHEAGHVAASYFLHVPFKHVTIIESEDAAGHVLHEPMSDAMLERIEAASYSGLGGFVDATTRRWVEQRVIVALAGGLAQQQAMSHNPTEVGSGLVKLTDEAAAALAAKHGGEPEAWVAMIGGGDMEYALSLVEQLSGGNYDEAGEYLGWLTERTRTMLANPDVWLAVEAVADALVERRTLSAREARRVIRTALDAEYQQGLDELRQRIEPRP